MAASMKRAIVAAAVSAAAVTATTHTQQPAAPPAPAGARPGGPGGGGPGRGGGDPLDYADNEGWISLFDGQSLAGWDGDTRFWSVKDGAIYVEPSCERPTGTIYIVWQGGEPANFMLKFESKGTANVNGGVQYRSYLTADTSVSLKYPNRGGGGFVARGARPGGPGGPGGGRRADGAPAAGRPGGPAGARPGGPGGRGPQCANPGTPPSAAEKAKWDMAGPQFDFDANNMYPGQYYEQLGRGIVASPGQVVIAEPGGRRRLAATLADRATLDSWFKKDDYNQFLLIADGTTHSMFMNGHLVSMFIDHDPAYFRASGKIGIEVEGLGAYYTRNVWLKRL